MADTVIKVENLSKAYQLGQIGTGTISRDLERFWATKIRGKEDPFLKIGERNDRTKKGNSDIVWSLRDIDFDIAQGEAVGIIGKNGAGKSTLLKLLSRVTAPTTGNIKVKGRIASLLEVGTGFHPELTGRENIYLNGAILGMRKKEITRKLDEIIDFSGVERYVDTPVKRYSSGMYVRLAFAVAAHLDSEILIVDEVLAVGDAEFQKKCLGKMGDISRGQGRTVLFVSHNMAAVQNLCSRGIVLSSGQVSHIGDVGSAVSHYMLSDRPQSGRLSEIVSRNGDGKVRFAEVEVCGRNPSEQPISGGPLKIILKLDNPNRIKMKDIRIDARIDDEQGQRLSWISTILKNFDAEKAPDVIEIEYLNCPFNAGNYVATLYMTVQDVVADWIDNAFDFAVESGDFFGNGKNVPPTQSRVLLDFDINAR